MEDFSPYSQDGRQKWHSKWAALDPYYDVKDPFDPVTEVEHFKWVDFIIYHTPIWWFQLPHRLKQYIDEVFMAGQGNGIFHSDGRSHTDPNRNYGTGGLI